MFAHLHLHSEYSLLDGACRIERLLDKVKELGMDSCAITDHGVMYGVVDFYRAAKKRGIHPVIGCEVYVCEQRLDKQSAAREYSHLVLLCENQTGYQNLIKLVSRGFTEGFYYKPRVDFELLREYGEGLIALSACLSGDIPRLLYDGNESGARAMAHRYMDIFPGRFYIELQDHNIPGEKQVLPGLIKLAHELELPLVATNDVHYIERADAMAQEVLMCIQTGKTLADPNRMRMNTDELFLKSEAQMRALFPNLPEAIERTHEIAMRCNVEFDFESRHLPKYQLPEGVDGTQYLRELCEKGLAERYPADREDARDRLEYELSVIISMGFVDYFLIVWDFIKYAKEQGIAVGPGRGSGAGSIVAYTLDITGVDPLKYNLLFERFLNPERISMPDLDIDFCYERRQEVIDYVARKYGEDHVSQIITFGTMAARGVIRDVGRVLDVGYAQVDRVAKMVPNVLDMTLEKALEMSADLRAAYQGDPVVTRLIDIARQLEGMPRHASTHAAGVLITSQPVSDYVPLQTNDDVITTQFPMGTLEALGLLKMDFLGLRTLTVINDSLHMIEAQTGTHITPDMIPTDDPRIYAAISAGDTDGIFQLEGGGMRSFLMNMKPHDFEDIINAISLYRPGPMDSIPRYIAGKQDPSSVVYEHPKLRPILGDTYGCMVYQEQVMRIVRDLAGYSLGRSDLVRKAMAKKKKAVMAQEKEYFINGLEQDGQIVVPGAVRLGVPRETAEHLYEEMSAFASYAFNKSHAVAYGLLAVQTAYLKTYYLPQFMAALMNSVTGTEEKIAQYIQCARESGVRVLPPHVNHSQPGFVVELVGAEPGAKPDAGQPGGSKWESSHIRFGLNAVKNVGRPCVEAIVAERNAHGPFKDLYEFCERLRDANINKRALECLVRAGAFDGMALNGSPVSRAQWLSVYEQAATGVQQVKKNQVQGQISLFEDALLAEYAPAYTLPDVAELSPRQKLEMEKETTGVYISGHPLDEHADKLAQLRYSIRVLKDIRHDSPEAAELDGASVRIGGIVIHSHTKITRSGGVMAFVTLEDLTGSIECLMFPRAYERCRELTDVDSIVIASGTLSLREEEEPKLLIEDMRDIRDTLDLESITTLGYATSSPGYDAADLDYAFRSAAAEPAPGMPELGHTQHGAQPLPNAHAQGTAYSAAAHVLDILPAPLVTPPERTPQPDSRLYLRLPNRAAIDDMLPFLPAGGTVPVYFNLADEQITLCAPAPLWTLPCANLLALKARLGAENVKLVIKRT